MVSMHVHTVRPLLKDTWNKGHHKITSLVVSTKEIYEALKADSYSAITFLPLKSRQPLYSGELAGPNVSFVTRFYCMYTWTIQ